ncbi:DNA polymerase III subunit gamma and tau [Kineosporia babensis]|uniref:DNA polymerase III subunit gamma/tau n=1 Tax=Kineosporia babensis TaxID=499548 RepID=A0A9X1NPE4_9ACTN|nr:DNA polymerase III subunit gamma and tau [Kineosporia babensis]
MTTALYRRYRPESFAEVIGQEQVTGPLSVALNKNRVNHAYLFSGPRGCGKTTSARILARCLNCEQGPTPTPCGTCPSCVDLARGGPGSLDVVEIDAASHGGVDDARDLRERAAFAPVRDRYKVFIIDEAHMVSPQGFNALLKIVEEPPEHIRFIFATTEPEKVIGTIRSRTHHYPFRLVPPERLVQYLAELCEREGVAVGQGVLPLVVRAGTGSVRDTLSVLDQLIGGSGEDGLDYATAIGLLGYTDGALLDDVADALAAGDGATVFRVIDRVIESGHDPRRFVEDLLERLRDLLVIAAVPDGGHAIFRGMPDDQLERMRHQAGRFGSAELSRAADVANAALTEMTGATSPRLQLELLCARLLLPSADDAQRGLGARVDRLEKRMGSGAMVVAAPGAAVAPAPLPPLPDSAGVAEADANPQTRSSGLAAVRAAIGRNNGTGTASAEGAETELGTSASPQGASAGPDPSAASQAPAAQPSAPAAHPEPAPQAPPPTQPQQPAQAQQPAHPQPPVQPSQPQPGGGDLEAIRRNWDEVLNSVRSIKRITWTLVSQNANVLDYDGRRLLLGFDSAGLVSTFGRGPHANFMRQALIEVIGLDCAVEAAVTAEFRAGGGGGPRPSQPAGPSAPPGRAPEASTPSEPAPVAPQPRSAPSGGGWPEQPPATGPAAAGSPAQPQASAWTEVRQTPSAQPSHPAQSSPAPQQPQPTVATGAQTSSGGVGVATRETPAAPEQPRSIGAAAARAAAAAAVARAQQNQQARAAGAPPAARPATQEEDRGMPTPQASPYDDIPPDLSEPMREDEAPPDGGWSTPQARRPQNTRPQTAPPASNGSAPANRVVDLSDDGSEDDGGGLDTSPMAGLVGVQAVERLLGGRIIEERDL